MDAVRIFIPASLVSDTYEKELTNYAGQEIEFVISEYNPKRRRYIGDRKQLTVAKKAELQKELFEKIKEGDIVEGVGTNDWVAYYDGYSLQTLPLPQNVNHGFYKRIYSLQNDTRDRMWIG